MKRLFLAILLAFPLLSQGQSFITVGPKVGASYVFATGGSQPSSQPFYTGIVAGGFLTVSGTSHFGLTVEALFAQRGFKAKFESLGESVTATTQLQYLDIPVLFRYFFNENGKTIRPNIFIGPSFNILTQARAKSDATGDGDLRTASGFRKFDLGAVIGVGVNIRTIENQWLNIDARYNQGTLNLLKDNDKGHLYNGGVVLAVGYGFGI